VESVADPESAGRAGWAVLAGGDVSDALSRDCEHPPSNISSAATSAACSANRGGLENTGLDDSRLPSDSQ